MDVFREFFGEITKTPNFKFTADMATALRRVRSEGNVHFTLKDLLDVYYGKVIMLNMIIRFVNGINF